MKLERVKKDYVQKSRVFLYPLLGIRRGVSSTPVETYMSWKDVYTIYDFKLVTVYHLRDDQEFKSFEETQLMGNPLFENYFELENGYGVYVFDFSNMSSDYKRVLNGKYSRLSSGYKSKILNFYKNQMLIQSYLYPEKFFKDCAKLYNVEVQLLKEVGELCNLPDLEKETLQISKKVLNFESVENL